MCAAPMFGRPPPMADAIAAVAAPTSTAAPAMIVLRIGRLPSLLPGQEGYDLADGPVFRRNFQSVTEPSHVATNSATTTYPRRPRSTLSSTRQNDPPSESFAAAICSNSMPPISHATITERLVTLML